METGIGAFDPESITENEVGYHSQQSAKSQLGASKLIVVLAPS